MTKDTDPRIDSAPITLDFRKPPSRQVEPDQHGITRNHTGRQEAQIILHPGTQNVIEELQQEQAREQKWVAATAEIIQLETERVDRTEADELLRDEQIVQASLSSIHVLQRRIDHMQAQRARGLPNRLTELEDTIIELHHKVGLLLETLELVMGREWNRPVVGNRDGEVFHAGGYPPHSTLAVTDTHQRAVVAQELQLRKWGILK